MSHEAFSGQLKVVRQIFLSYFVILSSMDRSSRMKVGSVILDKSAPGRSWEMMCERTATVND